MMKEFARQYEEVYEKAEKLFDALDSLDYEYRIPNSYVYHHCFDGFTIDDGNTDWATIRLDGSWSTQGDWGSNVYELTLEEFENSEQYIADYEAKLKAALDEYNKKQQERLEQEKNKEYQDYLALKKKFEDG